MGYWLSKRNLSANFSPYNRRMRLRLVALGVEHSVNNKVRTS